MEHDVFKFKSFQVAHSQSSMKVGVDAVLLGAWAGVDGAEKVLDIGTGCGVIALMTAQRNPEATIIGIDIDQPSVKEASDNFANSRWAQNLKALAIDFPASITALDKPFDLIVSNPPFFSSGPHSPESRREKARHQDTLSVNSILQHGSGILSENGRISMIFPTELRDSAIESAESHNLFLLRECWIRNNDKRPEKRIMMEFGRHQGIEVESRHLTLFAGDEPTEAYRTLCKDFYLKF